LIWLAIFGAVLVIEGALYAAFPNGARRMLARIIEMDERQLRLSGLGALAAGLFIVWIARP
jgi:uncharacterized protein YjeT (DUF2065 family)